MTMNDLYLRQGAHRRLRGGHLWVYSNEVDTARNALSVFNAGDQVCVRDHNGALLGSAYMEPNSLICARVYAPGREMALDQGLLVTRLRQALALREAAFPTPHYRLVYGDSDFLPGLVVDRFGDYLVVQLNNAGVERLEQALLAALVDVLQPAGILLRCDSRARREQALPERVEVVHGDVPQRLPLVENEVTFEAPVWQGQKTGWFYDHRLARARMATYAAGARVLDVYSYVGGWGVQAAAAGARSVTCVDSSEFALEEVAHNAALNGLADRVGVRRGPADQVLNQLAGEGEAFDLVVLDPPAFIQRRRDLRKGVKAYRRINELALRVLRPGGVLVSGSCSMHLPREELVAALAGAASRVGCALQVLEQAGQGPDHPVHPAIPETEYLKSVFVRRLPELG